MVITKSRSDAEIQRSVSQEMDWDPRIDSSGISVVVKNGIVTLKGTVATYAMKLAAREGAHLVEGALDVVDELQIKAASVIKGDQELAQAVRNVLSWDVYVPDERIKSTVADGWVTLDGDVDRLFEREDAERAVQRLTGVRGVTNRIVVKPKAVDSKRIRMSIEEALARRAEREAKRIRVDVEGGKVKLSGKVDSWAEKNMLERLARYSPGVSAIENTIVIDPYA
jgi:osmotically-inducible protein OsmY